MFSRLLSMLILLLLPALAGAASYTGTVLDDMTGDPLPGAQVTDARRVSVKTDSQGAFTLETDQAAATVSLPGFQPQVVNLQAGSNLVRLKLQGVYSVGKVEIKAKPDAKKALVSKQRVQKEAIKETTTSLFPDVARTIQTLPGVTSDSDFSGLLYVRGGSPDEVVAFLDDMIIMNPYLWGGRMSVFNPNLVDAVEFYAGGYPAEANQALSALMNVRNKAGRSDKFAGFLDLSAATTDVVLEGPAGLTEGSSFILGLRRTHYDLLINQPGLVYPYFYDGQAKLRLPLGQDTLTVQSLFSIEGMDFKLDEAEGFGDDHRSDTRFHYQQRRSNTSVAYDWKLSQRVNVMTLAGARIEEGFMNFSDFYTPQEIKYSESIFQLRHVWEILAGDSHIVKTGFYGIHVSRADARVDSTVKTPTLTGYDVESVHRDFTIAGMNFMGVFVQDDIECLPDTLFVTPGVNGQYFSGNRQATADTRLALKWRISPGLEATAAAGTFTQYPMEASTLDAEYGNPDLRAAKAVHYIVGAKVDLAGDITGQVEAFYKDYDRLVVGDADEHYTNHGGGYAYGFDCILQKKLGGSWDGWLTYSYVTSRRRIARGRHESFGMNPPIDEWYRADGERPHALSLILNWAFQPGWRLAFVQKWMSGKPYTPVTGADYVAWIDEYVPRYGGYNGDRQPAYTTTDMKLTMPFFGLKGWSAYVQMSNIFDAQNVDNYYYNYRQEGGRVVVEEKALYQLPRMFIGGFRWEF